jgi:hypothetical protein
MTGHWREPGAGTHQLVQLELQLRAKRERKRVPLGAGHEAQQRRLSRIHRSILDHQLDAHGVRARLACNEIRQGAQQGASRVLTSSTGISEVFL